METLNLLLLVVATFFGNLYASSVGGASLLILPVMFLVGIPANIAVATNRLHRIFASGASCLKYMKSVKTEMKNLLIYSVFSIIGAIIGAVIVVNLNKDILKLVISIVLLILCVFFLIKKDLGLKEKKVTKKSNPVMSSMIMLLVAVYRSIVGSATGSFLRMYFVIKENLSFLQAATYSTLIAVISNVFATVVFIAAGIIDYRIALIMIVSGCAGSYLGAHIAIKKGNRFVRKLFLIVVVLTCIKLIWELVL
ncbi:sulfite exporter TauE/SafE family protein [Candidatus Woesearchaeota archaeon]|nr:sulfite exporter TauE/SafE family protein [Candidatus Woesearchaeota archaeon]